MNQAIILMLAALSSVTALATDTAVYEDGDFVRASIHSAVDARDLFDGLNLDEMMGRSGNAKVYRTSDEKVEVSCTKSTIPGGMPYVCTVSIKTKREAGPTTVWKEGSQWKASIISLNDAKVLYEALLFNELDGRSGTSKAFGTKDKKAAIYCTKSKIQVRTPFACTVSIEL